MDLYVGPLSHQSKMLKKYTRYCLGLYVTILPLSKALYKKNYSCNKCIVSCVRQMFLAQFQLAVVTISYCQNASQRVII